MIRFAVAFAAISLSSALIVQPAHAECATPAQQTARIASAQPAQQSAQQYSGQKKFVADSYSFGAEREMKESGEKGGTADINIGVGESQECTISKSTD
ncbi:MAG: hypothetical protein R3C58_01670 [Parvularculaceae bacterium]